QVDSGAVIAAPGVFLQTPTTVPGQVKGSVLRAGSVTMGSAQPIPGSFSANAAVIVKPGALIDVSGAAADIDVPTSSGPVRTQVTGDAGTITIAATHPSRIEGTLRGSAQGQSAGGAFELDFGKVGTDTVNDIPPRRIIVGQDVPAQGSTTRQGSLSSGNAPFDAYLGVGNLSAQGFDKLQLQAQSQIQFAGNMSVALGRGIRLDAPEFVATTGTQSVNFSAPQLALGYTPLNGIASGPAAPVPASQGTVGAALSLSS